MNNKKNIVFGRLLVVGLLGLGNCQGEEVKTDFIKIHEAKYKPVDFSGRKPVVIDLGDFPTIEFDSEGYSKQGIKEIHHYVDGELISITTPMYSQGQKCSNFKRWESGRIQEVPFDTETRNPNLKKGKHTLEAKLIDCKGNQVSDRYSFEVK